MPGGDHQQVRQLFLKEHQKCLASRPTTICCQRGTDAFSALFGAKPAGEGAEGRSKSDTFRASSLPDVSPPTLRPGHDESGPRVRATPLRSPQGCSSRAQQESALGGPHLAHSHSPSCRIETPAAWASQPLP